MSSPSKGNVSIIGFLMKSGPVGNPLPIHSWRDWLSIPLGTLLDGSVATLAGFGTALWSGAIIGLLAVLPLVLSPVHALRHLPEPEKT
jgi:hypothetical protein